MNNWDRMRAGKLYNANSTDIAGYHERGMGLCDKFNRTPIWMKKRKQRILLSSRRSWRICVSILV